MEPGDIDAAFSQEQADIADDAGLIFIMQEEQETFGNYVQYELIYTDDPRLTLAEYRAFDQCSPSLVLTFTVTELA